MCEDRYEHLAAHVLDKLDGIVGGSKDAKISVQELHTLYFDEQTDPLLRKFQEWLVDHPLYQELRMYIVGAPTVVRVTTRGDMF